MSSPPDAEAVMSCTACGASIYQEHLNRGLAGMWAGELLCPPCLKAKRGELSNTAPATEVPDSVPLAPETANSVSLDSASPDDLVATESSVFDNAPEPADGLAHRMRTFHAKLSTGAVQHLDDQVNTWLQKNPGIGIKFANTTVGVWEAKHAEPHLIITIFY